MLFRTIVNFTKILFLYPLIQPSSPKIKIPQNSNFSTSNGLTIGQMIETIYNQVSPKSVKYDLLSFGFTTTKHYDIIIIFLSCYEYISAQNHFGCTHEDNIPHYVYQDFGQTTNSTGACRIYVDVPQDSVLRYEPDRITYPAKFYTIGIYTE